MRPLPTLPDDVPRRRSKRRKRSGARSALVQFRAEDDERQAWIASAEADGYLSLSDWLRDAANARARTRAMLSSSIEHWCTPPEVLELVRRALRKIGFDPCSNDASIVDAAVAWDQPKNGLDRSWIGHGPGYVNPPYGDALPAWVAKIIAEALEGVEIIALVPARTDTQWFRRILDSGALVGLWRGRIKFLGAPHPAPFPSAICYWGPRGEQFKRVFGEVCNAFLGVVAAAPPRKRARLARADGLARA